MTMRGSEILSLIEEIKATSVRVEKERLLEEGCQDEHFKRVMLYALDPFKRFGIAKLKKPKAFGTIDFDKDEEIWGVLDSLAARELTGSAAQSVVNDWLSVTTPKSSELIRRIILKKPDCGITAKTINKVFPGMVPSFSCMLAHKYEEKRIKEWPMVVEPKLDGVRVLAFIKEGGVSFFSRSGKPYTAFDHLAAPLHEAYRFWAINETAKHGIVLDGEVVSGDFNKTVGDVRRKSAQAEDARFYAFDIIPGGVFFDDSEAHEESYTLRREMLLSYLDHMNENDPVHKLPAYSVNSHDEIMSIYGKVRERGLEGLIVKHPDGHYHRKRSRNWMKIKNEATEDLRVIGAFEGTGKYEGMLGGLIVDREGVQVRVGGGFSDEQRSTFWRAYQMDQKALEDCQDEVDWAGVEKELLDRLIEVEYHEVTPDGSLRHPRFVRFRDDKDTREEAA